MELESTSTTFAPQSKLAKLLQTWIDSGNIEDLASLVDFVKQIEPNVFLAPNSKEEQLLISSLEKIFVDSSEKDAKLPLELETLFEVAKFELHRLLNYDTLSEATQNSLYYNVKLYSLCCFSNGEPSFKQKLEVMTSVCKSLFSTHKYYYHNACRVLHKERYHFDFVMYVANSKYGASAFFKKVLDRYFQGMLSDVNSVFYNE